MNAAKVSELETDRAFQEAPIHGTTQTANVAKRLERARRLIPAL